MIASGGAGGMEHFYPVLTEGKADAALAASIFHFKEVTIRHGERRLTEQRSGSEMAIRSYLKLSSTKKV